MIIPCLETSFPTSKTAFPASNLGTNLVNDDDNDNTIPYNVNNLVSLRRERQCVLVARGELICFPIGFAHLPTAASFKALAATSVASALMLARGDLICFPIGFAHRPRAFGLQARAVASVAAYLPLLAAWFSA